MFTPLPIVRILSCILLATSVIASFEQIPGPKISKPKPYPYKQTNRAEILRRQHNKATRIRRAVPSNVPGPADVTPEVDDTQVYHYFYSGSGYRETDANPTNDSPNDGPPQETYFSGEQTAREAIQSCANAAYDLGYFAFQVFYRRSTDEWTCRSYIFITGGDESNPSYFNIPDDDVVLNYGYQHPYR